MKRTISLKDKIHETLCKKSIIEGYCKLEYIYINKDKQKLAIQNYTSFMRDDTAI